MRLHFLRSISYVLSRRKLDTSLAGGGSLVSRSHHNLEVLRSHRSTWDFRFWLSAISYNYCTPPNYHGIFWAHSLYMLVSSSPERPQLLGNKTKQKERLKSIVCSLDSRIGGSSRTMLLRVSASVIMMPKGTEFIGTKSWQVFALKTLKEFAKSIIGIVSPRILRSLYFGLVMPCCIQTAIL